MLFHIQDIYNMYLLAKCASMDIVFVACLAFALLYGIYNNDRSETGIQTT